MDKESILNKEIIDDSEFEFLIAEFGRKQDVSLSNKFDEEIYLFSDSYVLKGEGLSRVFVDRESLIVFTKELKTHESNFYEESFYQNEHYNSEYFHDCALIADEYAKDSTIFFTGDKVIEFLNKKLVNQEKAQLLRDRYKMVAVIGVYLFEKNPDAIWVTFDNNELNVQKGCRITVPSKNIDVDIHSLVTRVIINKDEQLYSSDLRTLITD